MKVVYRSILKEIREAAFKADRDGRIIDHIELTEREWHWLLLEIGPYCIPDRAQVHYVLGVRIEVK